MRAKALMENKEFWVTEKPWRDMSQESFPDPFQAADQTDPAE
jgi:hypothetical protein